jgi:hypothetical protein
MWLGAGFAASLTLYAILILAASFPVAWQEGDPGLLYYLPAVFCAIHLGAGFGLLGELLIGRAPENVPPLPSRAPVDPARLIPQKNGSASKISVSESAARQAVAQPETAG